MEEYEVDAEPSVVDPQSALSTNESKIITQFQKEPYLSFWGPVFEDYIAWLFETYASKKDNEYHPSPKYADGKTEICDSIVMCGNTAILIEAKLATCDIETKYSGDYKRMKTYLEKKLVGTPTNRKGVTQLLKAIENITTLPKKSVPPYLAKANKIIPLIVTKDEIGSGWVINKYLNQRFEEQIDKKNYKAHIRCALTRSIHVKANTVSARKRATRKAAEWPRCLDISVARGRTRWKWQTAKSHRRHGRESRH